MRKLFVVLTSILAFAIVLLGLNLRERDYYEFGTGTPPAKGNNVDADDSALGRLFPDLKFIHPCAGCGECTHPFEVVENRRVMSIHDHDGWYKLFWAGDEEYYYSDPIHMLVDWDHNRTAETPRGTWTLRLRARPATHSTAAPHECGQIPRDIALRYELVVSEDPLESTYHSGDGPLAIPRTFSWLIRRPLDKQSCLGWRLVGAPNVEAGPCPCAQR